MHPTQFPATITLHLVDAVRISIIEEFIAQAFSSPGESISQIIETPGSKVELLYKRGWNKFAYGSGGFTLLDFDILRRTKLKHLVVVHAGLTGGFFGSELLKHDLLAVRSTNFQITDKRLLVDHIRAGRDRWPGADSRYEMGRSGNPDHATWSGQHAILFGVAKDALKSKGIPRYLARAIEEGYVFSVKGVRYLFYETGTEQRSEFSHLEDLVGLMATVRASPEAKLALTVWKQNKRVEKPLVTGTTVSKVWVESFTKALLPYGRAERARVLKKNSSICRFIV
jgi:hypothetical protein